EGGVGPGGGAVLDDELLTKPFGEPLANESTRDIRPAARGKADHDPHWPDWISLGADAPGHERDRRRSGSQFEESTAWKHGNVSTGDHKARRRGAGQCARFPVTVPTPPPEALGVTYLSSSPFSVTINRLCSVPSQFGKVALSVLSVRVLPSASTA